ncbi:unnamed protein product, partial [Pleuronectes platessa]
ETVAGLNAARAVTGVESWPDEEVWLTGRVEQRQSYKDLCAVDLQTALPKASPDSQNCGIPGFETCPSLPIAPGHAGSLTSLAGLRQLKQQQQRGSKDLDEKTSGGHRHEQHEVCHWLKWGTVNREILAVANKLLVQQQVCLVRIRCGGVVVVEVTGSMGGGFGGWTGTSWVGLRDKCDPKYDIIRGRTFQCKNPHAKCKASSNYGKVVKALVLLLGICAWYPPEKQHAVGNLCPPLPLRIKPV